MRFSDRGSIGWSARSRRSDVQVGPGASLIVVMSSDCGMKQVTPGVLDQCSPRFETGLNDTSEQDSCYWLSVCRSELMSNSMIDRRKVSFCLLVPTQRGRPRPWDRIES
jgi:hypothetical protein